MKNITQTSEKQVNQLCKKGESLGYAISSVLFDVKKAYAGSTATTIFQLKQTGLSIPNHGISYHIADMDAHYASMLDLFSDYVTIQQLKYSHEVCISDFNALVKAVVDRCEYERVERLKALNARDTAEYMAKMKAIESAIEPVEYVADSDTMLNPSELASTYKLAVIFPSESMSNLQVGGYAPTVEYFFAKCHNAIDKICNSTLSRVVKSQLSVMAKTGSFNNCTVDGNGDVFIFSYNEDEMCGYFNLHLNGCMFADVDPDSTTYDSVAAAPESAQVDEFINENIATIEPVEVEVIPYIEKTARDLSVQRVYTLTDPIELCQNYKDYFFTSRYEADCACTGLSQCEETCMQVLYKNGKEYTYVYGDCVKSFIIDDIAACIITNSNWYTVYGNTDLVYSADSGMWIAKFNRSKAM